MKSVWILSALLLSTTTFAKTIDFQIQMEIHSEALEETTEDFLVPGCDQRFIAENICLIEKVMDEKDLPFDLKIGDAHFSISKSGLIEMGFNFGDFDQSTHGSMQLPVDENDNLLSLPGPLQLEVSGGDHASGVWSFAGTLKIIVE